MSACIVAGSVWVWARSRSSSASQKHIPVSSASCSAVSRRARAASGWPAAINNRKDGVEEGEVDVHLERAQGVEERGHGRDVSREGGRVEVVGA